MSNSDTNVSLSVLGYTVGTTSTTSGTSTACARHVWHFVRVRANQHVRREHRRCWCGAKMWIETRWADRTVTYRQCSEIGEEAA